MCPSVADATEPRRPMAAIGRLEEAQVDVDAAAVSDVLGIPINAVQRGLDELAAGSERRGGRSSS